MPYLIDGLNSSLAQLAYGLWWCKAVFLIIFQS